MTMVPPDGDAAWFTREIELEGEHGDPPGDPPTVSIHQLSEGPHGCVLWDCALVLSRHMLLRKGVFSKALFHRHVSVLDLSAGTGFLTLVAAHLGAGSVTATEHGAIPLGVLSKNVASNVDGIGARFLRLEGEGEQGEKGVESCGDDGDGDGDGDDDRRPVIRVAELEWGAAAETALPGAPFDVVIASDLVYGKGDFAPLIGALRAIVTSPETVIVLGLECRGDAAGEFLKRIKESGFSVAEVPAEELDPDYLCEEIFVLYLRRNDL